MPLNSEDDNPWGLAVPLEERNCVFGHFMSGISFDWLQSGQLQEWEANWGIQPTQFLVDKKAQYADWLTE